VQDWEVTARVQLRALVEKNSVMYDLDRFEDAYSVFTEDGILEPVPGQQIRRGRQAILARFALRPDGRLGDYGYVRHNITSHHIEEITETRATGYTYYLVYLDGHVSTAGYYFDEFVKVGDDWFIAHRTVHQDLARVPAPTHL
jgi:hypothetical protein